MGSVSNLDHLCASSRQLLQTGQVQQRRKRNADQNCFGGFHSLKVGNVFRIRRNAGKISNLHETREGVKIEGGSVVTIIKV